MRIFNVDVLEDVSLHDPLRESLQVEEAADCNIIRSDLLLTVAPSVLHFDEDILEFCHSSDFFVEKWTHQEFLCDFQLIHLGYLIDVRLRLVNLDEGLEDAEDASRHTTIYFFDLRLGKRV